MDTYKRVYDHVHLNDRLLLLCGEAGSMDIVDQRDLSRALFSRNAHPNEYKRVQLAPSQDRLPTIWNKTVS